VGELPDESTRWPPPVGEMQPPPVVGAALPLRRRRVVGGALAVAGALGVTGLLLLGLGSRAPGDSSETAGLASSEVVVTGDVPVTTTFTASSSATSVPPTVPTNAAPVVASEVEQPDAWSTPVTAPAQDDAAPAVVARPIPDEPPPPPPPAAPPPPWAASRIVNAAGDVSTDVGCAADTSAAGLDAFFAARVGPVLGWDYQHVYDLGGGRALWLFQDTFIDQSGTADSLGGASFVHNAALVQDGACFRLVHGGTPERPAPFEDGTGTTTLSRWFWPMGGERHGDVLHVFWAEMRKDADDPVPPDGLGWHPVATHLATYDPVTLARLDFRPAPNAGAEPIYGYAVVSDDEHTYLFGNTFEQNLARGGGWANGPHSGTLMFLARVPRGQLSVAPEYWRAEGWDRDPAGAQPILARHWAEFPMQPRLIDGQWVATTAVNGYWGDEFTLDVAAQPWGPWTTVESRALLPRGADPTMNTYHAHLLPQRDAAGNLIVTVSNNARDMLRDAWPNPRRYRPEVFTSPWQTVPPPTTTSTTSTTTATTTTSTTVAPTTSTTTTTSTTVAPTTSTTTTTSTTVAPTTSTTTTSTTTTSTTVTPTTSTTTSTVPTSATTVAGTTIP
jgi:hypothetical protein